jgi:hypothetical protein
MFAAARLRTRLKKRALLGLADLDRKVLRSRNLPFGSSLVVAARKPY